MQLEDYTTGTVSISNGSATLTGSGTAWEVAGFKAGDTFHAQGLVGIVASVDSDTAITLRDLWTGTTISGGSYLLRYQPDNSRMQGTTRQVLDQLRQGIWLTPDATGKTADKATYDDRAAGFRFLDVSVDPFKLYVKESDTSADWSSGADWVGPDGAPGTNGTDGAPGSSDVVGTSTTPLAIATGSKSFTIAETDRGWGIGARLRASSDANGANFMEGVVTAYSGTSLALSVDLVGGSGTKADWTINLAGERGVAGTDGTGTGDVVGPDSATDARLAAFDGATGKLLKDSGKSLTDLVAVAATDASSFGFVLDEDDMASDSATKLPTQQSVNQGKLQKAATRTAMKALDGSKHLAVYLMETGREGTFKWDSSDLSTEVTADTLEGIYVAPTSDTTGASGAWVRQGGWAVAGADARWFGYVADYDDSDGSGTENGAILEAALAVPTVARVLCPAGMARMDGLEIPKNKVVSGVRPTMQTFLNSTVKPSDYTAGTVWCSRVAGAMTSGRPTNELVRLNQYSGLKDVLLFWDNQPTPTTGWAPSDTPWAVRAGRFTDTSRDVRAEHAWMEGVIALAFTHAFEFQRGGEGGYIRDCKWHAFKIGLSLDGIQHIIKVENPEAYPYWSVDASVSLYTLDNYQAYEIGRVDGLKATGGLFSIYSNVGVNFIPSRSPDFTNQPAFFFDIDAIYSDSCTHGLMVSPSISGSPLTGKIGHLIVQRTGTTGIGVLAVNDYGIRLRGICDISVEKFEGSGSGFTRPGGHAVATVSGARMTIEWARTCEWDTGSIGAAAFTFSVAGTHLTCKQLELYNGTGWFTTTKRIFRGVTANGENNIDTGKRAYVDGIGNAANKAVAIDSTAKTLLASYPIKLVSAGFREYRVRGRAGAATASTNVAVGFVGASAITDTITVITTAGNNDIDGSWKTINLDPSTEAEAGTLIATGTPGDASATFLRLGIELR